MLRSSLRLFKHHLPLQQTNIESRLLKNSLTLRFFEYLNGSRKIKIENENLNKIAFYSQAISMQKTNNNVRIMEDIDRECMNNYRKNSSRKEVYESLDLLVNILPHTVTLLKFFDKALNGLINNYDSNKSKENFLKLLFYIGFYKKKPPGPLYMTRMIERYLDEALDIFAFSKTDLAIICTATYKTSVRIGSEKFHTKIVNELLSMEIIDSFIFVALIKSLRQNEIYSQQVLEKLAQFVEDGKFNCFDYQSIIHILPYIADNGVKNDFVLEFFTKKCIYTFDETARVKDIQKFLHSSALLNLKIDTNDLERLESFIMNRKSSDEYRSRFDHFVNAALSMWILDYHSKGLVELLLTDRRFCKSRSSDKVKLDSRMQLLLTCIEIEEPDWLVKYGLQLNSFDEQRPAPFFLVKQSLERLMNSKLKEKNAKFVQQIKNLNIAAVLVTSDDGKKIHYEVLDDKVSLSDSSPNGIFQLKIRLLEKLSCSVRVIKV